MSASPKLPFLAATALLAKTFFLFGPSSAGRKSVTFCISFSVLTLPFLAMFYNQNLDSAAISLLSLSMAASNAAPIPVSKLDGGNAEPNSDSSSNNTQHGRSFSTQLSSPPTSNMSISASNSTTTTTPDFAHKGNLSQSIPASVLASPSQLGTSLANASSSVNGAKHHRRLSSTGRARRRLSDAKDAANRPS